MALNQKKFFDEPLYFSESAWLEKGEYIAKNEAHYDRENRTRMERFNNVLGKMKWAVGDWLCEGVDGGIKPKKLKNAAKRVTGYQWGTLKNCMVVSRAVESSRRRDVLPYSFHVEVAKYAPEDQEEYLAMAVEKIGWKPPISLRDFRKEIEGLKRSKMTMEERLANHKKESVVILKIAVSRETEMFLLGIARAKNLKSHTAQAALWWMATEYVKEHKELKAELEAGRAAEAAEQKKIAEENEAQRKRNAEQLAKMEEDVDDSIPTY